MGQGAEGADEQRDDHGGGHAFAADIADDGEDAVRGCLSDLVEVPSNFARRVIGAFNAKAWNLMDFDGNKNLLHCASSFQFRGGASPFACNGNGTRNKEEEQSPLVENIGEIAPTGVVAAERDDGKRMKRGREAKEICQFG